MYESLIFLYFFIINYNIKFYSGKKVINFGRFDWKTQFDIDKEFGRNSNL